MNKKAMLIVLAVAVLFTDAAGFIWNFESRRPVSGPTASAVPQKTITPVQIEKTPLPGPAYQTANAVLKPTLSPAMFEGAVRAAYQVAQEMPETLAQLPCYCYCDKSVGHKSLHSCFIDDHGSKCGVCINSALTAYKLQKEKKLNPSQIREKIIAEYSNRR